MDFTIKRCERAEYQEFLAMANDAFGFKAENEWFEKNVPNCTPYAKDALDCEIEKNFIALCGGKVIGAVGAYDFDWIVSDAGDVFTVKAFGIGQVSCLPEFRGNGVMTSLLNHAIGLMADEGRVISFLGGDRFRYNHFGFNFGGNTVKFNLEKHRFEKMVEPNNHQARIAKFADYIELNALYETLPSYIKRSELAWKRHLDRYNHEFIIGELEGKKGYICVKNGNTCVEAAGECDIVLNLLNTYMHEKERNNLRVCYPYMRCLPDKLAQTLYNVASWVDVSPYGLVSAVNPNKLFDMFAKTIEKQADKKTDGLNDAQKCALINKLFGYVYHPLAEHIEGFEMIQPLCSWISDTDNI